MAAAKPIRASSLADFPVAFRTLLLAGYPQDCPEVASIWQRYFDSRSATDEATLFEFYAPLLSITATRSKAQNPELFDGPLADYISDGTLGLLNFIRTARVYRNPGMVLYVGQSIRRAIWAETRSRTWAGRKRIESICTIQRIRSQLTDQTGKVPDREAMVTALAAKVKNPNIYFYYLDEGIGTMVPRSQMEKEDGPNLLTREDRNTPDPSAKVMDEEVIRLAMKGLSGIDKKILRLTLAGETETAIAEQVGLSRGNLWRRMNGVLWEARCRADLAAHLGVEPTHPDEIPVSSRGVPVAISKAPPARLAG